MKRFTLYHLAHNAVRELAADIIAGDETKWARIDRIERRFRIVGFGDAIVQQWKRQNEAFLKEESAKHDRMNPDRITYLHR